MLENSGSQIQSKLVRGEHGGGHFGDFQRDVQSVSKQEAHKWANFGQLANHLWDFGIQTMQKTARLVLFAELCKHRHHTVTEM